MSTAVLMLTLPLLVLGTAMVITTTMAAVFRRKVQPSLRPGIDTVPPDVQARAMWLIARRRPVEAVKVVREATGMSLKDAKGYCDALRDGKIGPPTRKPLAERVRAHLDNGDRDGAVALVRTETGMAQDEALRFVAALER
jgi:hypothetical protein